MTWMTVCENIEGNFDDLVVTLGYDGEKAMGFRIHSEKAMSASDIAFCYPPNPEYGPPSMLDYRVYQII
jgi:hypothetical protein